MKIISLNEFEFESFSKNHPLRNYYQTKEYANLMKNFGFSPKYIGVVHNKTLIGASLILTVPIFMGFKYGYAPRGMLLNYNDYHLIPEIIKKLKSYLFKQGLLILKIDPLIIKSIRDKNGNIIMQNNELDKLMSTLKKCGFIHCGFNNYMEAVKPRWHAILNMKEKTSEELFVKLDKQIRNKLRKAAKFGIEIYKDNTNDINKMYDFIKEKGNYSVKYYETLSKSFKEDFELYFANLNTETYVKNSKALYEYQQSKSNEYNKMIQDGNSKGKNMRTIINKKMESDRILASYKRHLVNSTTLLKEYPEGITIGGAIIIKNGNTLNLLIDGFNEKFGNLCPNFLMKWRIIEKYSNTNIEIFDLNAIAGVFNSNNEYKGLNESKLGYNALATEYIGEFNLTINKPMYALYINTKDKYSLKKHQK